MNNQKHLPVVEAGAITALKKHLDRYMDRKSLEGYGVNASKWDEHGWGTPVSIDELGKRA